MRVIPAVLAAVLLTAACSSSTTGNGSVQPGASSAAPATEHSAAGATSSAPLPTDPAAASKADPCSLVTKAEADALAGAKVQAPQRTLGQCLFGSPTEKTAQLEVYLGEGAKTFYDTELKTLQHKFTDVPGVGDEAHLEPDTIFFKAKGTWVALHYVHLDDYDAGPALIRIAKNAAGRL